MIIYDYDSNGWLVGWRDAPAVVPSSTATDYRPIPPGRARWNGSAWVSDLTREQETVAKEAAVRDTRQRVDRLRGILADRGIDPEDMILALLADLCRAVPAASRTPRMTAYLNAVQAAGA